MNQLYTGIRPIASLTIKPYTFSATKLTLEPRVISFLGGLALYLKYGAKTIRTLSGAKIVSVKGGPGRLCLVPPAPGIAKPQLDHANR
jgi:hypothetical protein